MSPLGHFLLQWILLVLLSRALVFVMRPLRQPPVIGEMLAGIMLGPSLFARLAPEASRYVFEPSSLAGLQTVSQLGLILFMFTVGLHTRVSELRRQGKRVLFVSTASIAFPFLLGVIAAPRLYEGTGTGILGFVLFCGILFSITAFPVLARIIRDQGLERFDTARLALSCAALGDAAGWIILAGVLGVVRGGSGNYGGVALRTFALGGAGVLVFWKAGAPLVARTLRSRRVTEPNRFLVAVLFLVVSALYFERCGLHALFGAFLAGVLMPEVATLRHALSEKIESLASLVLLPTFFAMNGLRTDFSLLSVSGGWALCAFVIAVAIAGKLGGTALAARWSGMAWRESLFLGALMNTRGLMELVVLDIGHEQGIISQQLFTVLVIMTLVTTMMTGPLAMRAVRKRNS